MAYLGAAGVAPGHDPSPSPAIIPGRCLHKVVGDLGPPSGLQRLPHILHIFLLWPSPQCAHACVHHPDAPLLQPRAQNCRAYRRRLLKQYGTGERRRAACARLSEACLAGGRAFSAGS